MEIIELYTSNNVSRFKSYSIDCERKSELGLHSLPYRSNHIIFREFKSGLHYDWHTAPQAQFIIYLEGKVEVLASSGESRVFSAGEILFANDLEGQGHQTRTVTSGRAVIAEANPLHCQKLAV